MRSRPSGACVRLALACVAAVVYAMIVPAARAASPADPGGAGANARRVIIFVWDGLRPDSITAADTPNLLALAHRGVTFTDNHATYPTFTMMNAASIATGAFPETSGFFGNDIYRPGAKATSSSGKPVDFTQPVFTEDYGVLDGLSEFYNHDLSLVPTLLQAAQAAGLKTVTVGKSGPAYLQDYRRGGVIVDEKMVWPLALARDLQTAGSALPRTAARAFAPGALELAPDNGDPTSSSRPTTPLADGVTSDPTDTSGSPNDAGNRYLMELFISRLLPRERPDLSIVWLRSPDSTEHTYGVGSANALDAVHAQDVLLGELESALERYGMASTTDLIVMSDHGHSNTAGPAAYLPPRAVRYRDVGNVDEAKGFSVSGAVRLADLFTRAGFTAYDGGGCSFDPVLTGVKADGEPVYPPLPAGEGGGECGCAWAGKKLTTGSYRLPRWSTSAGHALVVAANGGSDYIYVPDHDAATVTRVVRFLQSREEVGAIFASERYGALPGTLSLRTIHADSSNGRGPDVILSYDFDENAIVGGVKGTEMMGTGGTGSRGMHGSFSPVDVHNVLLASGPHFRSAFADTLPSGNVDVAPTVAHILGFEMTRADGRPLLEALAGGAGVAEYAVQVRGIDSTPATGLKMLLPTSPSGEDVDASRSTYQIHLATKVVRHGSQQYTYFDYARAIRK